MIGWLSGTVREHFDNRVILDTGGVGYEVFVTPATREKSLGPDPTLELYIHTHVREDDITLFGFLSRKDREFFLLLLSVSGIGAKTAMAILASYPATRIAQAIRESDVALLKSAPGIGKRTAERMVVELRDKIEKLMKTEIPAAAQSVGQPNMPSSDVASALTNLGYKRPEIERALAGLDFSKDETFDTMFKASLKALS